MPKVATTTFLGSNRLFCFININRFGSFKNLFATITSLSELNFRCRFIVGTNRRSIIYELWQHDKQLKTMEMNAISCAMKRGIPFGFEGQSMETEITTRSEFPNGGKATVEKILASE